MPNFIYEPDASHSRAVLTLGDRVVRAGETFTLEGPLDTDPSCVRKLEKVPGRVVGGKRLPCIVPVVDLEQARALAAMSPAEVEMRKALDTLAEAVGLGVGAAGHAVVDAIKARLDAKPLGPAVEEAVRVVRETARTLDPDDRSAPQPGETTGPLGEGVRAITPSTPPVAEAVVDAALAQLG